MSNLKRCRAAPRSRPGRPRPRRRGAGDGSRRTSAAASAAISRRPSPSCAGSRHGGEAQCGRRLPLSNALRSFGRPSEAIKHYQWPRRTVRGMPKRSTSAATPTRKRATFAMALAAFDAALAAQPSYIASMNNSAAVVARASDSSIRRKDMLPPGTAPRSLAIPPSRRSRQRAEGCGCARGGHRALSASPRDQCKGSPPPTARSRLRAQFSNAPSPTHSRGMPALGGALRRAAGELSNQTCARILSPDPPTQSELRLRRLSRALPDLFTLPLLAHHDRREVEVFCFSSVGAANSWTRRLASRAEARVARCARAR